MTGLSMVLKGLGINFKPEHVATIEALIPQIPAKAVEIVTTVNTFLQAMDARQKEVESRLIELTALIGKQQEALQSLCFIQQTFVANQEKILEDFKNGLGNRELQRTDNTSDGTLGGSAAPTGGSNRPNSGKRKPH
jgi:hypothetical protein